MFYHAKVGSCLSKINNTFVTHSISPYYHYYPLKVVSDPYDQPVGDGKLWDLYAQLGEDCFTINYWAVHSSSGNHAAWADIPKFSNFVHFSPCGHSFLTMDLRDRGGLCINTAGNRIEANP